MRRFWRRRDETFDLVAELRERRPEPRVELVHVLVERMREGPRASRLRSRRLVFAGGVTATMLVALASVGGFSYAASSAQEAIQAVNDTFSSGPSTSSKGPGKAQYAKKCGIKPPLNRCRALVPDTKVQEGNVGTTPATFEVTLDAVPEDALTVEFFTRDGTAIVALDYLATAGTLSFNPGETSKAVTVAVIGETVRESDETFTLNLINPSEGLEIADGEGVGTIQNDDK